MYTGSLFLVDFWEPTLIFSDSIGLDQYRLFQTYADGDIYRIDFVVVVVVVVVVYKYYCQILVVFHCIS